MSEVAATAALEFVAGEVHPIPPRAREAKGEVCASLNPSRAAAWGTAPDRFVNPAGTRGGRLRNPAAAVGASLLFPDLRQGGTAGVAVTGAYLPKDDHV
jgi:hypothetical protein